jgi:hypothetical protein
VAPVDATRVAVGRAGVQPLALEDLHPAGQHPRPARGGHLPRDAVASLAERISGEIRDTDKRVRFQQTMLAMLRQAA